MEGKPSPFESIELHLLTLETLCVFWILYKNQIFALIFDSFVGAFLIFVLFKHGANIQME